MSATQQGCMEINMEETSIHMNDDDVRDYHVQQASIKAGYSYVPSGDNGRFSITLGEREEMEGAWFEPINYFPQLYEKIEWGLKLPAEVEQAIDNWIDNDQNGTEHYPALNPFDPEQIDVKAIVDYTDENGNYHSQPVFGFFYRDYQRITVYNNPYGEENMDDPDNWRWDEITTEYRFRFRWASDVIAHHSVRLTVNVPSMGYWELSPFEFDSYWGDPRNSFITTTPNHRYFATADGNVFFPVGQNMTPTTCECDLKISSNGAINMYNPDCSTCYIFGEDDPCCGLNHFSDDQPWEWRESFWRGNPNFLYATEHIAAYLKHLKEIEALHDSGANSFRTMVNSIAYEWEFEKLNNYYDRQHMVWELDKVFEKADELDMRIIFNMEYHITFGHKWANRWDWTNLSAADDQWTGNCYFAESDLTECDIQPISFFREEAAKEFYKKKVRYFIARFGYAANMLDIELLSEANNVGLRPENSQNDPWVVDQLGPDLSYSASLESRYIIGQWHIEMADYIKQELHHGRHLIAADFTGIPMWSPDANNDLAWCGDENFDESWNNHSIDVMTHSSYDSAPDRFQKFSDQNDPNKCQWNALTCIYNGQLAANYIRGTWTHVDKPVMHSENGAFDYEDTFFERDLWATGFSGCAASGFEWGKQFPNGRWYLYDKVRTFFENEVFTLPNIKTQNHWEPGYRLASSNGAKLSEIVYMRNNSGSHHDVIGILMNRTWNPATTMVPDITWDDSLYRTWNRYLVDYSNGVGLMPFVSLSYDSDDAPKIPDMGFCKSYSITYYDPHTLATISTADDDTNIAGQLKLKNFPTLIWERPYVLFKVQYNGDCILNSPTTNEEESFKNSLQVHGVLEQSGGLSSLVTSIGMIDCVIFPNPTNGIIHVQNSKPISFIQITNALGMALPLKFANSTIDLSDYADGVYFLELGIGDEKSTTKIIKCR
jgi:hypothetical protein